MPRRIIQPDSVYFPLPFHKLYGQPYVQLQTMLRNHLAYARGNRLSWHKPVKLFLCHIHDLIPGSRPLIPGIIKSSPSARNNYTNSFQKVVKCGIIENAFAAAEDRATLGSDSSAGADLNKGEPPKTEAEIALWKTKAINPFRKLFRKVPRMNKNTKSSARTYRPSVELQVISMCA